LGQPWGQWRDEQASIKRGQAPSVLLEAGGKDRAGGEVVDKGLSAAHDEILSLARVVGEGQPCQLAECTQIVLQGLGVAKNPRNRAEVGLTISEPVEEEDDVIRLLLHHPVEDVEQRRWNGQMLATKLEQAERAEGVEALLEAKVDEGFQHVRWDLDPDLIRVEAIEPDHVREDSCVARLLECLELERLAHHGVRLQRSTGADHGPRVLLGLKRVRPKGKTPEQAKRFVVQRGPLEPVRLVWPMLLEKRPAEQLLVGLRPDLHGSGLSSAETAHGIRGTVLVLRRRPIRTA